MGGPGEQPSGVGGVDGAGTTATDSPGDGGSGGAVVTTAGDDSADSASEPQEVAFVVEPVLSQNDNPAVPEVAILSLETNVSAEVVVTVAGGDEQWTLSLPSDTVFAKPILGLKPDTSYSVSVSVSAGDNTLTAGPLEWTTPALPDDFPDLSTVISDPGQMEPGMTMFNIRSGATRSTALLIIVDHDGVVRWYYSSEEYPTNDNAELLPSGNILFGASFCALIEMDVLGNRVTAWHAQYHPSDCATPEGAIEVPVVSFHHESTVLPNGNIVTLSVEPRVVDEFPSSVADPAAPPESAQILSGVVVEMTWEGEIVKQIVMADLLDPTRVGRGSQDPGWSSGHLPEGEQAFDWDHTNAVIYDEASDSYIISLRNQDAIVKVSREEETLRWILGPHANWEEPWAQYLLEPVGDLAWQYHQHAPELTPLGLGMYDNGNYRASAFEDPQTEYSRAVIFAIDEEAMTVGEVWSYGSESGPDSFFSAAMGDADWQPTTGNVLMVNAALSASSDASAQVLEVTPDAVRVFQLDVNPGAGGGAVYIYRAERIADIRR